MSHYYENSIVPKEIRRNFNVYDRINKLGIKLGTFKEHVTSITKSGLPIASVLFHESGLVYLSGEGGGDHQMNDDPKRVKHGQDAAQKIADNIDIATKIGNLTGPRYRAIEAIDKSVNQHYNQRNTVSLKR